MLITAENNGSALPEEIMADLPFVPQIIKRRVEVLNLPLVLTNTGLWGTICFAKNPGQAVVLLIDFLTRYEGEKLTANKLCELYPFGFYNEDALCDYIDNQIKPKKVKWSEIY